MKIWFFGFSVLACASCLAEPPLAWPYVARVTITTSHARPVQAYAIVHEIRCSEQTYRLRISYSPAKVEFESPTARSAVDLSHTSFGALLLERRQHGMFGTSCPHSGVNLDFTGYEFEKRKMAIPISYRLTINANGEIVGDLHKLKTDHMEVVDVLGRASP